VVIQVLFTLDKKHSIANINKQELVYGFESGMLNDSDCTTTQNNDFVTSL